MVGASVAVHVMSAATRPAYEWNMLPWRQLQRRVFKLQTRIYHAAHRGDVRTVHRLQRLLTRSWSAKCLAVRRVTQDNTGKKTAGVDGVKALSPRQRTALVPVLRVPSQAAPLRRVWIPKPHVLSTIERKWFSRRLWGGCMAGTEPRQ